MLFLYDAGLLNCSGVRHANVHNGVTDANSSKGFCTILGRLLFWGSGILGFCSTLLTPSLRKSAARGAVRSVALVAIPLGIIVEKVSSRTLPPSGLTKSIIPLPRSRIAILDS